MFCTSTSQHCDVCTNKVEYTQLNETQDLATQSEPVEVIKLVFGCRLQTCKLTAHSLSSQLSSKSDPPVSSGLERATDCLCWRDVAAHHLGNQERPCVIFLRLRFPLPLPIIGTDLGQFKASILCPEVPFLSNQRHTCSPQSTRQVLINIQTFAFKSSPIYSSFPSICETWQSHSGLQLGGGRTTRGLILRSPSVESDEITCCVTWGQGGAAACSRRVNIELVLVARFLITDIVDCFLICRLIPISNIWRHSHVSFAP